MKIKHPWGMLQETKGMFFWDYSGKEILGRDSICVLLGATPGTNGIAFHSFFS